MTNILGVHRRDFALLIRRRVITHDGQYRDSVLVKLMLMVNTVNVIQMLVLTAMKGQI